MIEEGTQFPAFELPDENGKSWKLSDFEGSKLILYFYPKDDTSGCTAEACEFRDLMPSIRGAKVVGISPDNAKSHRKFVDKHNLNFTLLSDLDHHLAESLGLWVEKTLYGKKYMGVERTTFLLDEKGKVLRVWRKVNPQGHAAEVEAALG
jgi:peroxiredoxin Q/BCP